MSVVTHTVKCWPEFFRRLADGSKTFEVRKNDRGYQCGDDLVIKEWDPGGPVHRGSFTGRSLEFRIGFVFSAGFGCNLGDYVVLSLLPKETRP